MHINLDISALAAEWEKTHSFPENERQEKLQEMLQAVQIADEALGRMEIILEEMRATAKRASEDLAVNNKKNAAKYQKRINDLTSQLNEIATSTQAGSKKLLDGNFNEYI